MSLKTKIAAAALSRAVSYDEVAVKQEMAEETQNTQEMEEEREKAIEETEEEEGKQ